MATPLSLDCIGGFVVTQVYGLDRATADMNVIELAPREAAQTVMTLALRGGPLARKHHVCIDRVGVATVQPNGRRTMPPGLCPITVPHYRSCVI
jgi:hypothetical protein